MFLLNFPKNMFIIITHTIRHYLEQAKNFVSSKEVTFSYIEQKRFKLEQKIIKKQKMAIIFSSFWVFETFSSPKIDQLMACATS